jgi:hypothetical protein
MRGFIDDIVLNLGRHEELEMLTKGCWVGFSFATKVVLTFHFVASRSCSSTFVEGTNGSYRLEQLKSMAHTTPIGPCMVMQMMLYGTTIRMHYYHHCFAHLTGYNVTQAMRENVNVFDDLNKRTT